MGCFNSKNLILNDINDLMNDFFFRVIDHEFIKEKIEGFNNTNKTYHEFWNLTRLLGIHPNLKFQVEFWESAFVKFYDVSLDGVLFLFILLCDAHDTEKKYLIKLYLSSRFSNTITNDNDLIMNLSEFKNIILVYLSCLTTIPFNILAKTRKNSDYNNFDFIYSESNIKNFTEDFIKNFVRKNYYINTGAFFDANFDLLIDDNKMRKFIFDKYVKDNLEDLKFTKQKVQDSSSLSYSMIFKNNENGDKEKLIKRQDKPHNKSADEKLESDSRSLNKNETDPDNNSEEIKNNFNSNLSEYKPFNTNINASNKKEFRQSHFKYINTQ